MSSNLLSKATLTQDRAGNGANVKWNDNTVSTPDESDQEVDQQQADSIASMFPRRSGKVFYKTLLYNITVEDCGARFECNYYEAYCQCHPTCLLYNDCCYDYLLDIVTGTGTDIEMNMTAVLTSKVLQFEAKVPQQEAKTEKFIFEHSDCIQAENRSGAYWMINKCPGGFEDSLTSQKCENGQYYGLDSLPVEWTDSNERIWLFRNIFCAFCHGRRLGEDTLVMWKPFVKCFNKDDKTIILAGIINLYDIPPSCRVSLKPPKKISDVYQRKCDYKAQHNVTCESSAFQRLCDSYMYYVKTDTKFFRNPHCAMCESELTDYHAPCSTYGKIEGDSLAVDLKFMFDFDPEEGFAIKATCHAHMDCLSFEIFDCLSSQCRPLICESGQMPYFGKCIDSNGTAVDDVWYDALIPYDDNNNSENLLFLQMEVKSSELYPIVTFTDWLQNMTSIKRVVDIDVEQHRKKPDDDDEIKDEEGSRFHVEAPTRDNVEANVDMPSEETETDIDEKSNMEEQRRDFADDNTEQNRTSFDNVVNNGNVGRQGGISERGPRGPTASLESDDMTRMTDSQSANGNKENIPNDAAVAETDNDNGVIVQTISANENMDDDIRDDVVNKNSTINDNKWGEMPSDDKGGVHFQYLFHAKVISKTTSILSAKELIDKFDNFQMMSDADFKITAKSFSDLEHLICDMGNLTVVFNASYDSNMTTVTLPNFGNLSINDVQWAMSDAYLAERMFDMAIVCLSKHRIPDMNCSMTYYRNDEVYFKNDTMYVRNALVTYEKADFIIVGQRIFVCVDKLIKSSYVRFFEYSQLQKYLSIITSAFSLFCLLVICLMHIIFPKMRNNHGLNIFALSLTMLLVQALLLVQELPGGAPCLIYAVVLHFLVLLMFVWMNIIGYDMTITFYNKTVTGHITNYRRFVKYCIVSAIVALIIIVTGLLLDENNSKYGPRYGEGDICWLTSSDAIILFFIAPMSASIFVNIIMFAIILHSIQSAKIKATVRTNSQNRTYTLVYFKLSLILGFTWIVGVIAAFVSVGWLWYIHIALNGLQGLSLFLCSIVNARTVRLLREKTQIISFSDTRSSKLTNSN